MGKPVITVVGSFAVGMTLRTDRMPVFGETLLGRDFDMGPGGKGSNQAVALARLGADVTLAGMVGKDALGDMAIALYEKEGVDTRYLQRTSQRATGAGFIILNTEGDNGIVLDMGANALVDESFVEGVAEQIARSDIVMTVLELPVAAASAAMRLGRDLGVRTILNPAPATPLTSDVLNCVDYLTPNETELRVLLGLPADDPAPTRELAGRLRSYGVRNLIVTMGGNGALVMGTQTSDETPSVSVKVVDTTGAGDAFNAGLAIALAEGKTLLEAVRFATMTGALACTRLGVIPALPTREDANLLYEQTYG